MNAPDLAPPPVVIGVDPGPIPGVVVIRPGRPVDTSVFQCDAASVLWLLRSLLQQSPHISRYIVAVERFVVGPRASKLSTPGAAALTRNMIGAVANLDNEYRGVTVVLRSAAVVMPWASDKRLGGVGLYTATKGMQHARAAARHALFAAVQDAGMADPLSPRGRTS